MREPHTTIADLQSIISNILERAAIDHESDPGISRTCRIFSAWVDCTIEQRREVGLIEPLADYYRCTDPDYEGAEYADMLTALESMMSDFRDSLEQKELPEIVKNRCERLFAANLMTDVRENAGIILPRGGMDLSLRVARILTYCYWTIGRDLISRDDAWGMAIQHIVESCHKHGLLK